METQNRSLEVGDAVVFVDEHSRSHNALITAVHGEIAQLQIREDGHHHVDIIDGAGPTYWRMPCVNLLFTSADESKQDPYGRQIERESSVVHKTDSTANGNYWMWPGEEPNPIAKTKS